MIISFLPTLTGNGNKKRYCIIIKREKNPKTNKSSTSMYLIYSFFLLLDFFQSLFFSTAYSCDVFSGKNSLSGYKYRSYDQRLETF